VICYYRLLLPDLEVEEEEEDEDEVVVLGVLEELLDDGLTDELRELLDDDDGVVLVERDELFVVAAGVAEELLELLVEDDGVVLVERDELFVVDGVVVVERDELFVVAGVAEELLELFDVEGVAVVEEERVLVDVDERPLLLLSSLRMRISDCALRFVVEADRAVVLVCF
jgi:hypothetical protein